MRRLSVLLALSLAACGGAAKSGPAWPKSAGNMTEADWHDDGGESIEPHVVTDVAAVESSGEPLFDFSGFDFDVPPPDPTATPGDTPPDPPVSVDVVVPEETIIIEGEPPPSDQP